MSDQQREQLPPTGNAEAFPHMVAEHLGWVYGTALRQVRDHHLAEDVTQAVFLLLARKATSMPRDTRLTGWLFRAVRYCSQNALKLQRRRQFHEKHSAVNEVVESQGDWWERVRPVVDEAVARLSRADRDLVLARYYRNQPYEKIGKESGLTPDAARKRVGRAVEQLRSILRARSAELPEQVDHLLAKSMASVAPAGLAGAITASAKGGASASVATLVAKLSKTFWLAKVKVAAAVTGIAVLAGTVTAVATRPAQVSVPAATALVVATTTPKPASPEPLPTVAVSPARENAVYVNFRVLIADLAMTELRKIGTPLEAPVGAEQWSCDNEMLRQLLRNNFDAGVIGDQDSPGVAAHADKPQQWNRRLVGNRPLYASIKIPGEPWTYRYKGYSLYTARTAAGQAMISLAQTGQPMLIRDGAQTPPAQPARKVYASAAIPVGQSIVEALPLGNTDLTRWYLLTIVQVYSADMADAPFLASAGSVRLDAWLTGSARQWLIDARRSTLWYARLPATDAAKWVWSLPGKDGPVTLSEVTDTRLSTSMAWSPDGGRCVSSRPSGPLATRAAGPMLSVVLPDYRVQTVPLSASGPVTLGIGHGSFTRIGVLPIRDGAKLRVGTSEFRYDRATVYYDNDPATDIAFVVLDQNGKEFDQARSKIWTGREAKPVKGMPSDMLPVTEKAMSIAICTRERMWRTFDSIVRQPAVAAPTDAEVLASFAKPLDVPVPPVDGDQYVDPFAAAQAKTLFVQADAGPRRMRWSGDSAGREYGEGQGFRTVTDGSRCYRWADGAQMPTISQWSQASENSLPGATSYRAMTRLVDEMASVVRVGQETVAGVPTTVYEGIIPQLNNQKVKAWKDDLGRVMKLDLWSTVTISVRYDLPADGRWFAVPEALKSRPADDEKGLEIARTLTERPAIFEKQDGPRLFRLHEVMAGEDGMRFVCCSTQLTAKAANLVRFAPYGRNWGRGWIHDSGFDELTQYRIVPVARIDAPDRSIRWYILVPKDKSDGDPWRIHIEMSPGTPNTIPLLENAGFIGFGATEFELPASSNGQPMALDDYLQHVYADVHSYTAAMPPTTDEFVKPATGSIQGFIKDVQKDIEKAKAGESLPFRAN